VVHYDEMLNASIYQPNGEIVQLGRLINHLHEEKFMVRLSCIGLKGYIDNPNEVERLIQFAKKNKVEQVSYRSVNLPGKCENAETCEYAKTHAVDIEPIRTYLDTRGTQLMKLAHGAIVYDCDGQNFCLTNCLTLDPNDEMIRQLIFMPDGHLYYDWAHTGAILL